MLHRPRNTACNKKGKALLKNDTIVPTIIENRVAMWETDHSGRPCGQDAP